VDWWKPIAHQQDENWGADQYKIVQNWNLKSSMSGDQIFDKQTHMFPNLNQFTSELDQESWS
jgi:hypothetical protein